MTHRFKVALATACAALATAGPAQAVTHGAPDNGRHPFVGGLVSYDPETGDKYLICSGTLVSPTVFVTAAHCLEDEPSDLYVSFDPFIGAPDVGPGVVLHHGRAYGDPAYEGNTTGPGDTHDVAVVVLDEPVRGIRPAQLVGRNDLDQARRALTRVRWTVVGYGREGYDPAEDAFYGGGSRRYGLGTWDQLQRGVFTLEQDDEGGTCNGDSGGPVLAPDHRTVVGVSSDGDELCQENGIYTRLDTAASQRFLKRFDRRP